VRIQIGGIPGWWCEPRSALPDAAILHLHGGWFNWGSARAYRNLVGQIARSAGANAFVPDYRLAPEHPFPAAGEDAQACLQGLVQRGVRAIDSAGGNLALTLLSIASRSRAYSARVVCAAVHSPVTDLAMTGSSWQSRAEADPYFVREQADPLVEAYLNGHDARDPMASPMYGDLGGLPPIRVHVGDARPAARTQSPGDALRHRIMVPALLHVPSLLWKREVPRQELPRAGQLTRTVVRRPERGQMPAEVQFEVARNTVTDVSHLRAAGLCTGPGKCREEHVDA